MSNILIYSVVCNGWPLFTCVSYNYLIVDAPEKQSYAAVGRSFAELYVLIW